MIWGLAIPNPFPLIAEVEVTEFPMKAVVTSKQAWKR